MRIPQVWAEAQGKRFLLATTSILIGMLVFMQDAGAQTDDAKASFSFGLIADCQYCKLAGDGRRKYSMSKEKLESCVEHLNRFELEFVVHLGDFIDRDFGSFKVVGPIFDGLKAPGYHVLGNHDFAVSDQQKALVPAKLGLENRYYAFQAEGWRFLVLDGNDISFIAWPKGSAEYQAATDYYSKLKTESPKWNGAVGKEQLAWLTDNLDEAKKANEKVMVFCHFPVFPANSHNLWNADEVMQLLEQYDEVKAYVNGHNHAGNYGEKNGIHYLTLKAMVDTEENAYAVMQVFDDRLEMSGFGREKDRSLKLRIGAAISSSSPAQ